MENLYNNSKRRYDFIKFEENNGNQSLSGSVMRQRRKDDRKCIPKCISEEKEKIKGKKC